MGDSDCMLQGSPVIAIGNPLGLGGTVTSGIVSARDRDIKETPSDSFMQVDASINPGIPVVRCSTAPARSSA